MALEFLSPIHRASRQIGRYLEPRMRRLGLSNREAHLLLYLDVYGPCPVGTLHAVFGHPRSTLTSMLDRLEKSGLVTREVCSEDRRSFVVGLTQAGRQRAELVRAIVLELETCIRAEASATDLEGFRNVLAAVGNATSGRPGEKEES